MERRPHYRHGQVVGEAYDRLPRRIAERLSGVAFLLAIDPVYAGLHGCVDTGDGRSYRDTAHCAHPWHTVDRSTTVAFPEIDRVELRVAVVVVVHELGHALDERIDYERHRPAAVSRYAETNTYEAFAEAFTLWAVPELCGTGYRRDVLERDERTRALFTELAR